MKLLHLMEIQTFQSWYHFKVGDCVIGIMRFLCEIKYFVLVPRDCPEGGGVLIHQFVLTLCILSLTYINTTLMDCT